MKTDLWHGRIVEGGGFRQVLKHWVDSTYQDDCVLELIEKRATDRLLLRVGILQ